MYASIHGNFSALPPSDDSTTAFHLARLIATLRMLYRKAGYDYPIRLIYFVEKDGVVKPEEEVFIYPKDEKDDEALLNVLRERLKQV